MLSRKEPAPNNWIRFGRYCFNPEAFEQGNVQLEQMVEKNPDLVLLDEIGPLELQNLGWAPAIDLLLSLNNTRITSYNVCYTKLLRDGLCCSSGVIGIDFEYRYITEVPFFNDLLQHGFRITSYNVCYTKLLREPPQ